MPSKVDLPLHVYQVLEEEYSYLYGPIPEEPLQIQLFDDAGPGERMTVEAALDWRFRKGHVRSPRIFAARILASSAEERTHLPSDAAEQVSGDDWTKDNLKRHLRDVLGDKLLRNLLDEYTTQSTGLTINQLEDTLNKLLVDAELYRPDRFSGEWVSRDSRGLLALHTTEGPLRGDDLAHLNRLLLEDAFPELEKIHSIRSAAICSRLHNVKPTALCLSGGGLRSSTFSVGLLQSLARHNLLKGFDYLSTVSGGSFAGSWLAAWVRRHPGGLHGVTRELASHRTSNIIDPDPEPLLYLRESVNSLTSKPGILSADTWTAIGIYLRNLLLNWAVFIPLLMALLMIPRLLIALMLMQPEADSRRELFRFPWPAPDAGLHVAWYGFHLRHIFLGLGMLLGSWALAYVIFNQPRLRNMLEGRRPWFRGKTGPGSFILMCLFPLLVSAFCFSTYFAWSLEVHEGRGLSIFSYLNFGLFFTSLGWLIASVVLKRLTRPRETNFSELLGLLVVGLLGGTLFFVLAQTRLGSPVLGYDRDPAWWMTPHRWYEWTTEVYVCAAVPLFLLVFFTAIIVFIGMTSTPRVNFITDEDREWWARFGAWLLISAIIWAGVTTLVIFGPILLLGYPQILGPLGGFSGLLVLLLTRSSKLIDLTKLAEGGGRIAAGLRDLLPRLALLFIAILVVVTSGLIQVIVYATAHSIAGVGGYTVWGESLTNAPTFEEYLRYLFPYGSGATSADSLTVAKIAHMNIIHHTSLWFTLGLTLLMTAVGFIFARLINLNIFALHDGYRNRNRLIRVFLGASRPAASRRPNTFTGFDPADNLHMADLRQGLLNDNDFHDARKLAEALLDTKNHRLSAYLRGTGRLKQLAGLGDISGQPGGLLLASLRADLNDVLANVSFPDELGEEYLQSHPARGRYRDDPLFQNRRLINRRILEAAYPGTLVPMQPPYRLFEVINAAANFVQGHDMTSRSRETAPFSITPLHCGSIRLGYRDTRDYGGGMVGGISLGTAAAISGASLHADSEYRPNSPAMTLLLTLFSMRIGWWLGNPGHAGHDTYRLSAPSMSFKPLLADAFGMMDEENVYTYLTDGGHFESLGLYEMVLRRCHLIVLSDCTLDESYDFDKLGDAIRLIRVELGIPIEFTDIPIGSPPAKGKGLYWDLGRIRYSVRDVGAPDGVLLYIKPAVYGDEPRDILTYKKKHSTFPHQQVTGDQPFDSQQFESYRALGTHIMDTLSGDTPEQLDLYDLIRRAFSASKEVGSASKDQQFYAWMEGWLRQA